MYGLPIYRTGTYVAADRPACLGVFFGCLEGEPTTAKSSLRLASMVYNHFTLLISQDWKHLRAWGNTSTLGNVGVADTATAQTAGINWKVPSKPEDIGKVYTNGYHTNWGTGVTIFKTDSDRLYGNGNNVTYMLNRREAKRYDPGNYELIAEDVYDWCPSGTCALYYIRNNGKLYALGTNLHAGYGFANGSQKALTVDTGPDGPNYLGISDGKRVFSTTTAGGYIHGKVAPYGNFTNDFLRNTRTFVIHADGTVSACGNNEGGSLGVNSNDEFIYTWQKVKTNVNGAIVNLNKVIDISVGNYSSQGINRVTTFLTSDGFVYTCGINKAGILGLGLASTSKAIIATKTNLTDVSMIAPAEGGASMLAVTTDNKLFAWGLNTYGQLGTGDELERNTPTSITFPNKKIKMIHGGGMYGVVYGAFLVVTSDGCVYAAGYNGTYALGFTNENGVPPQTITTFTENQYYGPNPQKNQDPARYPLLLPASQTAGLDVLENATLSVNKTIKPYPNVNNQWKEDVFVKKGMKVSGTGIPADTFVKFVDKPNKKIILTNPVTTTIANNSITYTNIIRVYAADICGYWMELAQKCVSEDNTLYMSGWNQLYEGIYNFNPYIGTNTVLVPSAYESNF